MNIKNLIAEYTKIYRKYQPDFNILTTIHVGENDHTNILRDILNMKIDGKCVFMKSFIEDVLGEKWDTNCDNLRAYTQVPAIALKGNKASGYIDLVIKSCTNDATTPIIIVENKVCKAGDQERQLDRYYHSFVKVNPNPFEDAEIKKSWNQWWNEKNNRKSVGSDRIRLVYLTDEPKEPGENSLDKNLKANLTCLSYSEHLYDWYKDKVLPRIPYGKNGFAATGMVLYLEQLRYVLGLSDERNAWSKIKEIIQSEQPQSIIDGYEYYNRLIKKLTEGQGKVASEDDIIMEDLIQCVKFHQSHILSDKAPEGWTIHTAPGYITFFPTDWKEKYGGIKTATIHFTIDNWQDQKAKLLFEIHGNSCRKYISPIDKGGQETYNEDVATSILDGLKQFNPKLDLKGDKWTHSKGHYYWDVSLDKSVDIRKIDSVINGLSEFVKFIENTLQ